MCRIHHIFCSCHDGYSVFTNIAFNQVPHDIGTVVLPDATVKIFLTATPEARATRRWKEYQAKGIDTPYEEVLADVKQRDYQDTHRAAAPLKQADDAVLLDTSELDFEQSLAAMKKIIAEKVNKTIK